MRISYHGSLPDGLDRDEVFRLAAYASRITEHAVMALAKNRLETSDPSVDRLFYMHGLSLCRSLAPEAVEAIGVTMAEMLSEAAGDSKTQRQLVAALNAYYFDYTPLPEAFGRNSFFSHNAAIWSAVSDVHSFITCFMDRTVPQSDPRDIAFHLQNSLAANHLVNAFNLSEAIYTPAHPITGDQPETALSFVSQPLRQEQQRLAKVMPPRSNV